MDKKTFGLDSNLACALCYITWIAGLVFFLSEKEDKRIRFHALQSIMVGLCFNILSAVIMIVIPILGGVFYLLYLGLIIFMFVKCYGGQDVELPVAGKIARDNA